MLLLLLPRVSLELYTKVQGRNMMVEGVAGIHTLQVGDCQGRISCMPQGSTKQGPESIIIITKKNFNHSTTKQQKDVSIMTLLNQDIV